MTQPIIRIDNLGFQYPSHNGTPAKSIFSGFSLEVKPGEIVVIEGRSGSGKTTLLRLMAWLEEPTSGVIYFNGEPYSHFSPPELRRKVSLVAQVPIMLDGTVEYNLGLGLDRPVDKSVLETWLHKFDLEPSLLENNADSLSVGQKQRVAVIRNLLIQPQVLLLDEPTSGLDPNSRLIFIEAINKIVMESGLTVIWISHDTEAIQPVASKVINMVNIENDN